MQSLDLAHELHRNADEIIRLEGELRMPLILLVLRRDPRTMELYHEPSIKVFNPDDRNLRDFLQDQDLYLHIIRSVADRGDAIAAGLASEVWVIPDEDRDEWAGRFDKHPKREVRLHIHVEHVERTDLFMHCSVLEQSGNRRLGILIEEQGIIQVGGRFGGLLNKRGGTHGQEATQA